MKSPIYNRITDERSKKFCCQRINELEGTWNIYFERPGVGGEDKPGSWPMLKLWRKWMEQTADFMSRHGVTMPQYVDKDGVSRGKRQFKADDAHELFTRRYLGVDKNNRRYSWVLRTNDPMVRVATIAQRVQAMAQHEAWAVERGIELLMPEDSEFRQLQAKQNI